MSKYKICYKVSIWREWDLGENINIDILKEKLSKITDIQDLELIDCVEEMGEDTIDYNTEERLIPEENDGQSTIELYEDNKIIWDNMKITKEV